VKLLKQILLILATVIIAKLAFSMIPGLSFIGGLL